MKIYSTNQIAFPRVLNAAFQDHSDILSKIKIYDQSTLNQLLNWHSLREPKLLAKQINPSTLQIGQTQEKNIINRVISELNELIITNISDDHTSNLDNIKKSVFKDIVRNDIGQPKLLSRNDLKKIKSFINKTVQDAYHLKFTEKVKYQIVDTINYYQLIGFIDGISWAEIKEALPDTLFNYFSIAQSFLKENELEHIINDELLVTHDYYVSRLGSKFKAFKNSLQSRTEYTLIKTDDGTVFKLLNTLSEKDAEQLSKSYNINVEGKTVLGKGGFGVARLAINIFSEELVVVKKFNSRKEALTEAYAYEKLSSNEYLLQLKGMAHITTSGENQRVEDKYYLFIEYGGDSDGFKAVLENQSLNQLDPMGAQKLLNQYTTLFLKSVVALHDQRFFHRDIKPENFFIKKNRGDIEVKLGDYGRVTDKINERYTGTFSYSPIEAVSRGSTRLPYSAIKHDAFSTGMTILVLKLGYLPGQDLNNPHLIINDQAITLNFKYFKCNKNDAAKAICTGVINTRLLPGNTLDEVIAKLLESNPKFRITPKQALMLPYFNSVEPLIDVRIDNIHNLNRIKKVTNHFINYFLRLISPNPVLEELITRMKSSEFINDFSQFLNQIPELEKTDDPTRHLILRALSTCRLINIDDKPESQPAIFKFDLEGQLSSAIDINTIDPIKISINGFTYDITIKIKQSSFIIQTTISQSPLKPLTLSSATIQDNEELIPEEIKTLEAAVLSDIDKIIKLQIKVENLNSILYEGYINNQSRTSLINRGTDILLIAMINKYKRLKTVPINALTVVINNEVEKIVNLIYLTPLSGPAMIEKLKAIIATELDIEWIANYFMHAYQNQLSHHSAVAELTNDRLNSLNQAYPFIQDLPRIIVKNHITAKLLALAPFYTHGSEGTEFRPQHRTEQFPHRIITTIKGETYQIMEALSEADINTINQLYGEKYCENALVLTDSFSKTLYAKNSSTQEISIVRIFNNRLVADNEIAIGNSLPNSHRLVHLTDCAHITSDDQSSSYLFYPFSGDKTLEETKKELQEVSSITDNFFTINGIILKETAMEMLFAVNVLHESGISHRNITLNNFQKKGRDIRLGNFSLSTKNDNNPNTTIITTFAPPEQIPSNEHYQDYSAKSHDSFSLALCLYELKYGVKAHQKSNFHLVINGRPINLMFFSVTSNIPSGIITQSICTGLNNTEEIPGITMDEVIAKLLESNPKKRMTPEQAMQLPYFTNAKYSSAIKACHSFFSFSPHSNQFFMPYTLNEEELLNEHQRTQLAQLLDQQTVPYLSLLGTKNIDNIVNLLIDPRQQLNSIIAFNDHRDNQLELRQAITEEDILKRNWAKAPLYDKLSAASQLARLTQPNFPYADIQSTTSKRTAILQASRALTSAILSMEHTRNQEIATTIKDKMLIIFHKGEILNQSQLLQQLNTIISLVDDIYTLSDKQLFTLNKIAIVTSKKYIYSDNYIKQLQNPDGREFESKLVLSVVENPPSIAMKSMMAKILDQIQLLDPDNLLLQEWSTSIKTTANVYPFANGQGLTRQQKIDSILSLKSLVLFYDFHHFISWEIAPLRDQPLMRAQQLAYQEEILDNRGGRISLASTRQTNKGGISLGDKRHSQNFQGTRNLWARPVDSYYSCGEFAEEAASHDVPLGTGLSGRTTQHIFGQRDMEAIIAQSNFAAPLLSEEETQLFMMGLWATLCADGGHSLAEVQCTANRISRRGIEFIEQHDRYQLQTMDKKDFFYKIYSIHHNISANTIDQHHQFYSCIPDEHFQKLYYNCWDQLCEKSI